MKKLIAAVALVMLLAGCSAQTGAANGNTSLAQALTTCGQTSVVLSNPANPAAQLSKLGASNGVVVNEKYLFVGLSTKWNKAGLGNVALACVANELKLSSSSIAAIKADAEEQKAKAKAFAKQTVDLTGDVAA